jgi:hypothetical protein
MLRLSCTSTIFAASGKCVSDKSLSTCSLAATEIQKFPS